MNVVKTEDGSSTLFNPEIGEHYHSTHGALQESKHVFLKSGLQFFLNKQAQQAVSVLEIGFGTGLNYLVTAEYCLETNIRLDYTGIELNPLSKETLIQIGNIKHISPPIGNEFLVNYENAMHSQINTKSGKLFIDICDVTSYKSDSYFDIIYFDAFAAIHQPEMWSHETLAHVCSYLKTGGVFVTYAITGNLKRIMKSLGFAIEKAPGAPGKREMLRAVKQN
ncbi:tRNA (5-methylaminomethyl-2-thiouridine)(34)-methyltransferase MnmD [Albibacterium sp.]|uniref:tRNA (5-methylaminomethyl-2-thiouridine)(34)-methyltransferase MnmD n=1 Tax=Albibacterium sp. TaxID=2952885 RepID=UPI002BDB7DE8|nr:tRNA (5-methylaminomethyl-2-thiouridine)(34)-methyltransferase MnmD [Albibacterium sp.]HUH19029.1 tRNA (5-methylaminomethyl-2-thiouridine)(34)-methyltransferase MnmD [Albibacterium sp.]